MCSVSKLTGEQMETNWYSFMVYSTIQSLHRTHSTKRREGINPNENALRPQLIQSQLYYNTSSLVWPMIFRLTAPNWERPSPYYGSHIIMSISGIYLLISIHTLYHSVVLSFIQVHEIFPSHIMSPQIYVCFVQQPGTN